MRSLNRVVLIGRIGREPEIRNNGSTLWGTLSVATNRSRKEGEEWVDETDWHQVKVFGRDAEYCQKYLKKGCLVSIEGTVAYERWTDKAGEKHYATRILSERIALLSTAPTSLAKTDVPEPESEIAAG